MGHLAQTGSRGRHQRHPLRREIWQRRLVALTALALASAVVGLVTVVLRKSPGAHPAPTIVARGSSPSPHRSTTSVPGTIGTVPASARVLVVGDSLGIDLGYQLEDHLGGTASITLDAMGDTGLANSSYYDWPTHLQAELASVHPSLVVVFVGANDDQGLYVAATPVPPGSAAWDQAYAQRVRQLLVESVASGARVVWVGMPPMAAPGLDAFVVHIDGIFEHQVARVRGALYLNSAAVLGTPTGGYQASGGPQGEVLRTSDGVHLTSEGASLLAGAVISSADHRWPGAL